MKVGIIVTTYNHEDFIAQALDSVLMQDVNFDYEIVLSDDCSSDRTVQIATEFRDRYPDKIRLLANVTNLGSTKNFVQTINAWQGEYIATLDGDDFWTSPHKLQRQVDFLDAHPQCSMCFHGVKILKDNGSHAFWFPPGKKERYSLSDLLRGNFIATGSLMCRNGLFTDFPDWFYKSRGMPGDWLFFCLHARQGDIGFINEAMGVYRLHGGGMWTAATAQRIARIRSTIALCKQLDAEFDYEYKNSIRQAVYMMKLKILITHVFPFLVTPLLALKHRFLAFRQPL